MEGLWFGIYISIAIFGCSKEYKNLAVHGTGRSTGTVLLSSKRREGPRPPASALLLLLLLLVLPLLLRCRESNFGAARDFGSARAARHVVCEGTGGEGCVARAAEGTEIAGARWRTDARSRWAVATPGRSIGARDGGVKRRGRTSAVALG